MSLEVCQLHGQLRDYICARNQDNQLLCRECFLEHSQTSGHSQAVRLSLDSKEFFLQWTEYVLKKMVEFKEIVSQMGYSKIFQMKLQPNHPKGSVNELNFQDIQKVAMQALQQHRAITQGNLTFIKGTTTILQMMVPQFFKDLYNIICEDTKFNLSNMLIEFRKKLINSYPQKEIYKFASFNIVERELLAMEERRRALLAQYQSRIVLLGKGGQLLRKLTDKEMEKDYMSPAHHSSILLNETIEQLTKPSSLTQQQQIQAQSPTNISTISNPSMTQNQTKQMDYTQRDITDTVSQTNKCQQGKISHEQLSTTIAFLRENEVMYREKVMRLEQQNVLLKSQVERLAGVESKVKELERQLAEAKLSTQGNEIKSLEQKVSLQLSTQLQASLKQQIHDLTTAQVTLIQQNAKVNRALKDLQDIAQGRSRTISDLQQQIKTLTQNVQLKQRSIQQLNMLISNQQEQIAYRQNQVQILGEQIKKKLQKIEFLQKSIQQHTKLVSNEQLQLSYRQNEVQTLNQEIQKLKTRNNQLQKSIKSLNSLITNEQQQLAYRQNEVEILQTKITKLLQKIKQLQNSIHELNNLIGNQQEEIKYRQNEVGTLNSEVRKLLDNNKKLAQQVKNLTQRNLELAQGHANNLQLSSESEQKSKLLQTQLNLINEQNIQLTEQVKILKQKNTLIQSQLKTQVEKSTKLQVQLKALRHNYTMLETEVALLKSQLLNVRAELTLSQQEVQSLKENVQKQDLNKQLAAQVIELESELLNKRNDIKILSKLFSQDLVKYLTKQQMNKINQKLSTSLLSSLKLE